MWPALEHVCRKQPLSASILFFHTNLLYVPNICFSIQICYMFLMSKCGGNWDLGRCIFSCAKRKYCAMPISDFSCSQTRFVLEVTTAQRFSFRKYPLCIWIFRTYSRFGRKNNFLALGVYFPQTWLRDGGMFAASRSRLHYYWRIVSFPQQRVRWNVL